MIGENRFNRSSRTRRAFRKLRCAGEARADAVELSIKADVLVAVKIAEEVKKWVEVYCCG